MKHLFFLGLLLKLFFCCGQESDSVYLEKGTWISGVEGGISNSTTLTGVNTDIERRVDYLFNINSGYFLNEKIALGLNCKLSQSGETRTSYVFTTEEFYFGPWFRYHIPMQHNWFIYGEMGVSYVNYYSELYANNNMESTVLNAQGVGVNPGVGIVFFVSKNAAFNVRWNYQWNLVKGQNEVIEQGSTELQSIDKLQFGTSSLMFGFQLYLHEFFF